METNFATSQSVRRYFAHLSLHGQSRAVMESWPTLRVESFFVAMNLPTLLLNRERQECGVRTLPLGDLFRNINWG